MKYINLIFDIGISNFLKKVWYRLFKKLIIKYSYFVDLYIIKRKVNKKIHFNVFDFEDKIFINSLCDYKYTSDMYINNKCAILGYGIFNISNNNKIDFNRDFVNNISYENLKNVYFKELRIEQGGDIKVPWEVGRLKELISLSVCAIFYREEVYFSKIQDVMKSFQVDANFPNGIHWLCPMEVSIRMLNLIISYSILSKSYNKNKLNFILNSIYQHYLYLKNNNEFNYGLRNNHYFCCINSLLIAAFFFRDEKEFVYYENKVIDEFFYQFNADGSNFESSTCYHRYSLEMIAWSSILTYEKFNFSKIRDRFLKAINFTLKVTNNITNNVPIIGDNDSGFFLRLQPLFTDNKSIEFNSNFVLNFLYPKKDVDSLFILDSFFYKENIKYLQGYLHVSDISKINIKRPLIKGFNKISKKEYRFKITNHEKLNYFLFEDFGLLVIKGIEFYCSLRFGGRPCGHMHNDALSIELWIDGENIVKDPGTFVYTSNNYLRNLYRAYRSHFVPQTTLMQQNELGSKLFTIGKNISSPLFRWNDYVYSTITVDNISVYRFLKIKKDEVYILDISLNDDLIDINFDDINELYCLDYGKK
ncbi:heparinase II/III domain-containing protein [Photobacterium damselae]|uniref:heparinase II/III domain-containing protein n=1 Tax=Photobacterium damselae TaxID=38293 RepID=UPI004069260B